jgi:ubiquinone/menaquinone biosynthesis C-methylase UbiE
MVHTIADYLLGSSDREHARLIRQAARIAPITEGFFREAGIGAGQRVLDIGSGVGDVAMLAATIVGPAGEVVGVERDSRSIGIARKRAAERGFENVTFYESDVAGYSSDSLFDAVVGRYILQFLPNPTAVLRSLARLVRPGGVVAFQEQSWAPFVLLSAHVPLWSAGVNLLHEISRRAGVDMEMGVALHRAFQEAGLPIPRMRLVMELGYDADFTSWVSDVISTLSPQAAQMGISLAPLGPIDTLAERLQAEVAQSNTVVPWLAMVGAWCRTPER